MSNLNSLSGLTRRFRVSENESYVPIFRLAEIAVRMEGSGATFISRCELTETSASCYVTARNIDYLFSYNFKHGFIIERYKEDQYDVCLNQSELWSELDEMKIDWRSYIKEKRWMIKK